MLSRLRIRTKLASMVAFAALTVFAIIAVSASLSQSRMHADRIEQMRVATDLLYGLAQGLQDEVAAGKMTKDEAQAEFRKRGRKMQFNGGQGYPIAYYPDQTILLNGANPQLEGKITGAKDSNGVVIAEAQLAAGKQTPAGGIVPYLYPRPGQKEAVRKIAYARHFAPWDTTFSYGLYVDDVDNDVSALWWRLGAVGLGLMAVMGLVSWLIAHDILSALERLKARMQHIATGSLDQAVEETGRGDEIGRMAETLEVLRKTSLTARSLEAEQVAGKERSEQEKREALIGLANRFDASVGQLVSQMASGSSQLESTAKSMTGTAEHTNQSAAIVSSAATDASGRVQTVAAAAEELSSSISEISRQVAQSAAVAGRAVESARRTDAIVRALSDGAKEIESVAELISSIAAQTNLLALNATIEAARAGEAGRGFAVVASEVKSLASQTADATKEIGTRIAQIQGATSEAVEAIHGITATIEEVSAISTTIGAAIEEQGAATAEIARNVTQTAEATREVTKNIGTVSAAANQTGSAAGMVLTAASNLSQQAEQLSGEVNTFLASVRAA
jgi:methyl-accepting chemotaxis protein